MKTTRYLRKRDVAQRYGGVSVRTVERMVEEKKLPAPIYLPGSRIPLWSAEELEAADRAATAASARRSEKKAA
jgi:predicted DNA-binding transcriptional regulator AlpA